LQYFLKNKAASLITGKRPDQQGKLLVCDLPYATIVAAHPHLLTLVEAIWTTQGSFAPTTFLTAYDRGSIGGSVSMIIVTVMIATA
jgi:hypothetical protein